MTITPAQIEAWQNAVGRQEVRRQVLDIETLRRYAAAVGSDLDVERHMPPLGHWAYFLEVVGPGSLGADGHPKRGEGLMPAITLPRRMFASAALTFAAPLVLAQPAELTLTIAEIKHRSGRTGDLVFVEVDRVLTQAGAVKLTERQTIVYREAGEPTPAVEANVTTAINGEELWSPTPADLFRYSAATYNSHRIHYDLPYATGEEGYPALVIHGPFTAAKLCDFASRAAGRTMKSFSFRAMSPLFQGAPVRLGPGAGPGEVQATRCDGAVAMAATAEL